MQGKRTNELLAELNELEQKYGRVQEERDPNYGHTGEARARIELLKQELAEAGVQLKWDGWQYHIVE
jgi:hypothetical protein